MSTGTASGIPQEVSKWGARDGRAARTKYRIEQLQHAMDLAQFGARAIIITELTGLNLTTSKRIYREVNGKPPPPGQLPFTDSWYIRFQRRMLHALLVWQYYKRFLGENQGASKLWLSTYRSYFAHVTEPLVDINRAYFIPRLLHAGIWVEQACPLCAGGYPSPYDPVGSLCPACRFVCRPTTDPSRKSR